MYQVLKKSRAIQSVILLLTLFVILTIYPLRIWNETIPSVSNQILAGSSDSISENYMLQRFIAQYDHLGTINLYVVDFENGWDFDQKVETFIFRMLDSDMEIMFEEEVDTRFIEKPGFCSIYINEDLIVGKDYYYFLQGNKGSRVWFGLEETATAGTPYVSRLIYNYDQLEGYNLIAEYNYSVPLRKHKVFALDAILLLLAGAAAGIVELYFRKTGKDKLVTVQSAVVCTANILIAAGTVAALWTITIRHFFSGLLVDNLFYTAGSLMCSATLFYLVNKKRDRAAYRPLGERLQEQGGNLLQAVWIAGAVWACCNYMNGLYDIHHQLAERQFLVFFSLAALSMGAKKEIFRKGLAVYLAVAAAWILWYHWYFVDTIAMDEWDLRILRWGLLAAVTCGYLILNLLMQLWSRKKPARGSLWFGCLLALFFVMLVLYRNTREWPLLLAAGYSLFYLRYSLWDKKKYLLQNICQGLVIHFVCAVIFCFARRPFLSWIYPRYPFVFHTVTVTAVYLTFVMCACFVRLLEKHRAVKGKPLKEVVSGLGAELLLFGISSAYMLFTASRTGFLAVAAMLIIAVILILVSREKTLRELGVLAGLATAAVIWCFPMVFTAQRILPAVWNDVYRHDVEEYPDAITRGNEWDSMYYITVPRFVEVFNNKIFGIPEGGSTSYERSDEYQAYRARRFNKEGDVVWEGSIESMQEQEDSDGAQTGHLNVISIRTEEERQAEEAAAKEQGMTARPEEEAAEEDNTSIYDTTEAYANGRMDIFKAYLDQLNLQGHEEMGALLPDGSVAVHAHNIYLQVAYDHGIPTGILFILTGAGAFAAGCIFYFRKRKDTACAVFPAAAVVAFAMAGMVEWIFHLCNPAGLVLLLVLAPLLFDSGKKDRKQKKKCSKQEKQLEQNQLQ